MFTNFKYIQFKPRVSATVQWSVSVVKSIDVSILNFETLTYLREQTFGNRVKSKYRTDLSDEHLEGTVPVEDWRKLVTKAISNFSLRNTY